jgi:hypothetical protein
MKRIMVAFIVITVAIIAVPVCEAWQVNIKNSCNNDVFISVTGEHLFWRQIDCSVTVPKGTTGTCKLPGAICPLDIKGSYYAGKSLFDLDHVHCMAASATLCCCWDVNVEVVQRGESACELQLR